MSTRGTFKAGSVSVSHNILSTSFDTWCHCWQYPSLPMLPLIQVFKYAVKLFANCWELAVGGWSVPEGHFKGKICESTVACLDKKCLKWAHFLMFFWSQTDSSWGNVVSRTNHAAASVLSFLEKMYWSLGETLPHESLVYVLWKLSFMYFASFPPIIIFGTSFQGWKFMILESHWQLNQKGRDFYNCFWTLHWKVTCRNQCWTLGLIGSSADTFLLAPILICTTSMSAFKLQRTWKYLLHQHFTGCWSLAGGNGWSSSVQWASTQLARSVRSWRQGYAIPGMCPSMRKIRTYLWDIWLVSFWTGPRTGPTEPGPNVTWTS